MLSREDKVFYRLVSHYQDRPDVIVHSAHPPSGKTYLGVLVRLRKRECGRAKRDRYQVDLILQVGSVLLLQELKGAASELRNDISKLRTMMGSYTLVEFRNIMRPRVHEPKALEQIKIIIPAVGY